MFQLQNNAASVPFVKTKIKSTDQTLDMCQYFEQNKLKLAKARLESRIQELIDNCVAAGAKNIVVRHVYSKTGICLLVYDDGSGMDGSNSINNQHQKFHKLFKIKDVNKQKAGFGHFGEGFYVCAVSMLSNDFIEDRWEVYTKMSGDSDLYANICYAHLCNPRVDKKINVDVTNKYDPDGCGIPAISQTRKINHNELVYTKKYQAAMYDCKNPLDVPMEASEDSMFLSSSDEFIKSSGTLICMYTKQLWTQEVIDQVSNEVIQEAQYGPNDDYIDYMISDFSYTNRLPPDIKLHMKFGNRPIKQIVWKKYLHPEHCEIVVRLHRETGKMYLDTLKYKGQLIGPGDGTSSKIKKGKYGANAVIRSSYSRNNINDLSFYNHMEFTVNNVLNEIFENENRKKRTTELNNEISLFNKTGYISAANDNGSSTPSLTLETTTRTLRNNEKDDIAFKVRFSFKDTEEEGINKDLRNSKLYARDSDDSDRNKLTGWYFGMDIGNGKGERMVGELFNFKGEYYEQAHQWRHRQKVKLYPRGEIIIGKKLLEYEWMAIQPIKSYSGGFGKESGAKTFKSFCGMFALLAQNYVYDDLLEEDAGSSIINISSSSSSGNKRSGDNKRKTSNTIAGMYGREPSKRKRVSPGKRHTYDIGWIAKPNKSKQKGTSKGATLKSLKAENVRFKKNVLTLESKLKKMTQDHDKKLKKLINENKNLRQRKDRGKNNDAVVDNEGNSSGKEKDSSFDSLNSSVNALTNNIDVLVKSKENKKHIFEIQRILRSNNYENNEQLDLQRARINLGRATIDCLIALNAYVAPHIEVMSHEKNNDNTYQFNHVLLQGVNIARQKQQISSSPSTFDARNDNNSSSYGNNDNNHVEFHYMSGVDDDSFEDSANNNRNDHILEDKRSIPIQGKKIGDTEWKDYESTTIAARDLNLHKSHITKVCKRKRNKTGGYVFRYATGHNLPGEECTSRGGDSDVMFLYDSDTSSGGGSSSEGVLV